MCRDVRRHTHCDTVAAVHQQVRNLCRHHRRLYQRVVEVVRHIHGVLLQVIHDMLTHLAQSALRVSHGCGRVTIHATEVSLSVNKGVAHIPILRQPYQRSIYRRVAVGVILTQYFAHNAGTLLIGLGGCVVDAKHTVEYAAVYRLEAVSHIRQCACHNHRHRVVDVARLHLVLNVYHFDSVVIVRLCLVHWL